MVCYIASTWSEIDLENFEVKFLISLDWNNIKSLTFIYMEPVGRTETVLQITFFPLRIVKIKLDGAKNNGKNSKEFFLLNR